MKASIAIGIAAVWAFAMFCQNVANEQDRQEDFSLQCHKDGMETFRKKKILICAPKGTDFRIYE